MCLICSGNLVCWRMSEGENRKYEIREFEGHKTNKSMSSIVRDLPFTFYEVGNCWKVLN